MYASIRNLGKVECSIPDTFYKVAPSDQEDKKLNNPIKYRGSAEIVGLVERKDTNDYEVKEPLEDVYVVLPNEDVSIVVPRSSPTGAPMNLSEMYVSTGADLLKELIDERS